MKILDEIIVNFDLDCKILNDTPAKLKLRDKTLKGICFNLNDEEGIIPTMMLAKKNDEDDENIVFQTIAIKNIAEVEYGTRIVKKNSIGGDYPVYGALPWQPL